MAKPAQSSPPQRPRLGDVLRRSKPIRIGVLLLINAALLWLCEFNAGVILDHLGLTAEKTRIFNAGNGRDSSFIVQYDERLGYRLTPRAEAPDRFADSVGRTVSLAKADGVFRILCLGGSTTYGVGADKTNAYPAQLEDLLTRVYGGCGKAFEVLNVGVMGYHSWHSRLRFETELAALRPDLVLVMDAVNDLAASTAIDDSLAFDQEKDRLLHLTNAMDRQDVLAKVDTVLGERSNLYQLLRALGRKVVIVAQAGAADEAAAARERIERFGYRDNMRALVEAARSAGADCVLVDYPWLAATSLPPDAAAVTRRASTPLYRFGRSYFPKTNGRVARETAATVINPQPAFDALLAARPSRAGDLYFDEIHLTKYGNQILARQILDQLPQAPAFARFVAGCVPADADNAVKLEDPRIHFANGWPRPGDKPVRLALAAAEGVARDAEEYPGHVRLAPSDPARPGVVRLRAAPGGALQPMPHAAYNAFWYPRVACDTDRVEVLLRDRTLVALSGTKACRFTEAASRYGVDLPELRPGETLEVRLYGRAQVWLTGDKLFFAGDAAHPGY